MVTKFIEHNQRKIVIAITILAITAAFYWFQWRPSQIRQECAIDSAEWFGKAIEQPGVRALSPQGEKLNKWREDMYVNCLHKNGIKQ